MEKILMFSIDGGTWTVIRPMIDRGELPNLARLCARGASGIMNSMRPMASPMLWTTIASGKLPAKHGIKLFGDSSRAVRCKRIWQIFEDQGHAVGVCGYLMTWPPDVTHGFQIPDLFAWGPETFPPELQFLQEFALSERRTRGQTSHSASAYLDFGRNLLRNGVRLPTLWSGFESLAYKAVAHPPALDLQWRKILLQPRIYGDVFLHLYAHHKPSYASFHFHATDTLSHRYWKYLFPEQYQDRPAEAISRYADVIPKAYREADRLLGQILQLIEPDTTVIVLSDHGFRTAPLFAKPTLKVELLMQVLELPEYIIPQRVGSRWYLVPKDRHEQGIPPWVVDRLSGASLGQSKTPLFTVQARDDYLHFTLPRDRVNLDDLVHVPGYGSFRAGELLDYREELTDSGDHHEEGIVILYGDKIRPGTQIEGMTLLDVTPTLLVLAGLPVGRDMDGQVIHQAIDGAFLQAHPIRFVDSYETGEPPANEQAMTAEERDKAMERLKALGYL